MRNFVLVAILSAGLFVAGAARGDLLISEFQALNNATLQDSDGEYSDWIELYNSGDADVDLAGYSLTDDGENLRKWIFPEVTIAAGQFLVVFASSKDIREPGEELHTNFRLAGAGEPLFLISPDGQNVVAGFPPAYPPQVDDASYGLSTDSTFMTLSAGDAPVRAFVPADGTLGLTWTQRDFDDLTWTEGPGGVGFERQSGFEEFIGVDVLDVMHGSNATVYVRIPFSVDDPTVIDTLRLKARYDDGFVAFINGVRVTDANGPSEEDLAWDSRSGRSHSDRLAVEYEAFDISEFKGLLEPGENLLAIQGLNFSPTSGDMLIQVEIEAIDVGEIQPDVLLYFPEPTPGGPNGPGVSGIAPMPEFSHDSGAFTETQMVELSTDLEGAVIRYTINGGTPDESSDVYSDPIRVATAVEIRARAFADGVLPSPTARRTYILIAPALADFSSNLPIVIANTFGRDLRSTGCDGLYTRGYFTLIEPGEDGRARIVDEPSFSHTVGYRKRGSSTCGRQKFSFNVETRNDEQEEEDSVIFGWPEHADYAMYGPYNFDRGLVRNAFIYEISRQCERYAVRTRFVECYYSYRNGAVTTTDYWGVYVFMERNKRGNGRIDIRRTTAGNNEEPEVTGGYVMKVDRGGGGAASVAGGGMNLVMVHPKQPTTQQRSYLTGFLNQMRPTLNPNTIIESDGEFIDVGAWIDHHILNVYPKNVDAFRLSGYMFKDRLGPLEMGPIWDYDRTMGCADDSRPVSPLSWTNTGGDGGTRYFQFGWYGPLFRNQPPLSDSAWDRAYRARWRELRGGPLSNDNIVAVLDRMEAELAEAAPRNTARWREVSPRRANQNQCGPLCDGTFAGEMNHLRDWLVRRGDWMDSQFVEPPSLLHEGVLITADEVRVEPGFVVEITVPSETAAIWYTLDGSDPRAGSRPSDAAIEYTGPLTIDTNTRVTARSLDGTLWSQDVAATFVTHVPALTVTEIMYNPPDATPDEDPGDEFSGTNMEFVEIQNIGAEPIELADGFGFTRGVIFDFAEGAIATLEPGGVALVVHDIPAFTARYGEGLPVAGEYRGSLSNRSETIVLSAPLDVTIADFAYRDSWYPETDGGGFSLVNTDPVNNEDLEDAASWAASPAALGNPGVAADVGPSGGYRLPGDADGDNRLTINDASRVLQVLFQGQLAPLPCGDAIDSPGNQRVLDSDGDGTVGVSDAVRVLIYLFQRGAPPELGTTCQRVAGCEGDTCTP